MEKHKKPNLQSIANSNSTSALVSVKSRLEDGGINKTISVQQIDRTLVENALKKQSTQTKMEKIKEVQELNENIENMHQFM